VPKLDNHCVTFELVSVVCRRIAALWYVTISTKLRGLTYHVTTDVEKHEAVFLVRERFGSQSLPLYAISPRFW
jgi:hypothetical protein